MFKYGWASLNFSLNGDKTIIALSDVFDPLAGLMNWIDSISKNSLPAQNNIDKEGYISTLYAQEYDENHIEFIVKEFQGEKFSYMLFLIESSL